MDVVLAACDRAAAGVAALDLRALTPDELALGAVRLQLHIDRMKALHALMVVEADRARVWQNSGARGIADWLADATKTSRGDAISRVKLGDTLERSSDLARAVEAGEISVASAEALHDVVAAPPDGADLADLVDLVKGAGPRDAKAAAERWKEIHSSETEADRDERCHRLRSVRSSQPVDGLITTTVVLPILQSRQVLNAISHVAGKPGELDDRTNEQRLADGLIQLAAAYAKGAVVGGRERPSLQILFTADAYSGLTNDPGLTAQGDRIPADVVRHLAEDALVRRVVMAGSKVLDLGLDVRFATDDQYCALLARDGGCRWPGCHVPGAWCEIDHLIPARQGGPTDLSNLVMWCDHHHHVKHRSGVVVLGNAHDLRLQMPDGHILPCPPGGRTGQAAA